MTEEFAALPSEVTACGGALGDNAGQVRGVQSSVQSEGGGAGPAGCATEPGDMQSFWDQLDWVAGSLGAKADLLDFYGNGLTNTGTSVQEFDQGSAAPGTSV